MGSLAHPAAIFLGMDVHMDSTSVMPWPGSASTSASRLSTPSFSYAAARRVSTVLTLRKSCWAIARFAVPEAASSHTCRWRGVSDDSPSVWARRPHQGQTTSPVA
jgi:hypothetical protein